MTKIVICGIAGRMGQRLAHLTLTAADLELCGGKERPNHEAVGRDIGEVVSARHLGLTVSDTLSGIVEPDQVVVCFTTPEATLEDAALCAVRGVPMVVGTTGFTPEQLAEFKRTVADITCVFASNFSTAMNVLFKLVEEAARILGDDYDVEIIEAHHRHKVDAPSGSALTLAERAAAGLGRNLREVGCPRAGGRGRRALAPRDWYARGPRRRLGGRSHGALRGSRRVPRTTAPRHEPRFLCLGRTARRTLCRAGRAGNVLDGRCVGAGLIAQRLGRRRCCGVGHRV